MMENYTICNCKKVTYADVENVLHREVKFENVEKAFEDVQRITKCSTGCGGCHDKIMDTISKIMSKKSKIKEVFYYEKIRMSLRICL